MWPMRPLGMKRGNVALAAFVEEAVVVWDALAINPLLSSRRHHPETDIR